MLKFWPSSPVDLTPKPGQNGHERQNPFDNPNLLPSTISNISSISSSSSSATTTTTPSTRPSPPLTPTATTPSYHHHLLNTHHHLSSPSISALPALNDKTSHTVLNSQTLTPSASNTHPAALPTTSLSIHAPVFNMQQPPPPKRSMLSQTAKSSSSSSSTTSSTRSSLAPQSSHPHPNGSATPTTSAPGTASASSTSSSKGQIHVKLISARGLNVRSSKARPYVVVQFEQNEFVSREPTDEYDKEVKGVATNLSRNSSSTALSALGAISNKASRVATVVGSGNTSHKGTAVHTPSSSNGSTKHAPLGGLTAQMFGSRISPHNPVWKHEVSFDVTSDQSVITFNIYDRAVDDLGFLGTVQIKPVLIHDHTVDQWYKLQQYENEPVTGEMRVQITFEASKTKRALTPRDFEFLKLIGRGTFGRVFQVRKKDTKRIYAMKILSKREIIAKKEVAHTIGERKILQRSLESPFLVGLKFSFQTDADLYLVTDFKSGGELFWHLQRETRFSEERARFYIAELVLALEHLHKYDIVYRDLKPENILLDATGHVALCDFGLSKPDLRSDELTNTFCGTTEYLAPEVLLDEHGYSKLVDFWSLGVLLFEMCCGWSPFYAEDTQQMYKNICFGKIRFPKGVICEDGKQFVKGLLNRNPKHRLGAHRDAAELKEHPFFKSIDWTALALKQVTPPFKPVVESDESVANFDPEFTSADIREAGPQELMMDEEDPSEDWVNSTLSQSWVAVNGHAPNGPLGSDKPNGAVATPNGGTGAANGVHGAGATNGNGNGNTVTFGNGSNGTGASKGIQMPAKKKKNREVAGTPLTSSVQENFIGFTYHGESVLPDSVVGLLGDKLKQNEDEEGDGEEGEGVNAGTEKDDEDAESPVGRYAEHRRGMHLDGFDEDLL